MQNDPAVQELIRTRNNVIKEVKMVLRAVKGGAVEPELALGAGNGAR